MIDDSVTRVAVIVTFLRMEERPKSPYLHLPEDFSIHKENSISLDYYRYLQKNVGENHLWWTMRSLDDIALAEHLNNSGISIYILEKNDEPAGFFELNTRPHSININYFGLVSDLISQGIGYAFLRETLDITWQIADERRSIVTLNTCTADNPRALPFYLRAGFRPYSEQAQIWPIPNSLNLKIPGHLLVYKDTA